MSGLIAFLEGRYPIRVVEVEGCGRAVVAARELVAGEIVMMCSAACMHPLAGQAHLRCATCLSLPRQQQRLLRCTVCRSTFYCSPACQKAAWPEHKVECKRYAAMATLEPTDRDNVLLLARLQTGKWLRGEAQPCLGPVYHHTASDVLGMCPPPRPPGACHDDAHAARGDGELALVRAAVQHGLLTVREDEEGAEISGLFTEAGLARLLAAFACNNFATFDELLSPRASSVYPAGALLNHSCTANAVLSFACTDEAVAAWNKRGMAEEELEGLPLPARAPRVLLIRTLVDVKAGEELTHAYVDPALTRELRQAHLQSSYGFVCDCAACTAPRGSALDSDRFALASADGTRRVHVGVPTLSPDVSGRVETSGPAFVDELDSLTPAEAATVKTAREVFSLLDRMQVIIGMEERGVAALQGAAKKLNSIRLYFRVAFARELGLLEESAASEAPDELSYDSLLVQYAEKSGRYEPGEGGYEMIAIRCAELALLALRRILHPLHAMVLHGVTLLHHRYILFGDHQAALCANEHLLAHQRHVYHDIHPMLALQLQTGADLAKEVATWATPEGDAHPQMRVNQRLLAVPHTRSSLLRGVFVQHGGGGGGATDPVPFVSLAPVQAPRTDVSMETAAWYAARSAAAFRECSAILSVVYGEHSSASRSTREDARRLQDVADGKATLQ